jgi:hypothetical protein
MINELQNTTNNSARTEEERMEIAKEVIIKVLLPEVFRNVPDDKREEVFDRWYAKLLNLITEKPQPQNVATAPQPQPVAATPQPQPVAPTPQKEVDESKNEEPEIPADNRITQKQLKMIFGLARQLDWNKEQIEKKAFDLVGVSNLSKLTKSQASTLIDVLILLANDDIKAIYG